MTKATVNENQPLSMAAAQRAIGFESGDPRGRQLLRELEAREVSLGVEIVTSVRRRYRTVRRVTVAAIRRHAPDLLPSSDRKVLTEVRAYLSEIDERIDERVAAQVARRVEPLLRRLERP